MSHENHPGLFERLRRALRGRRTATAAVCATVVMPTDPGKVPFVDTPPDGLALVHVAPTAAEAEMLRSILLEAGFHVEFVPAITMGVFGVSGNNRIFVRREESDECIEFLNEYLTEHVHPAEEE